MIMRLQLFDENRTDVDVSDVVEAGAKPLFGQF